MQIEMIRVDGRLVSTTSEEGKERMKWEKPYNPFDPNNQFPMMLYKAHRRPDGVASVNETDDRLLGGPREKSDLANEFNRRCQLIVGKNPMATLEQKQAELQEALEKGWRKTQLEALAKLQAREEAESTMAAHRHYEDRNMSEAARAEADAADAASPLHVAEIPEKRRGGRPKGSKNKPKAEHPPAA